MRSSLKKIIIVLLIIILGVLSIARIMYVNSRQHIDGTHTYKIGETFEYNGFQVKAEKVDFYSADDIKELYMEIPEEVLPEKERQRNRSVCISIFKSGVKRSACS